MHIDTMKDCGGESTGGTIINVTDIDEDFESKIQNILKNGQSNNNKSTSIKSLYNNIISNKYLSKNVVRERCAHCRAQIYTHTPIIICSSCSNIIHYKCTSLAHYKTDEDNSNWYCPNCYDSQSTTTTKVNRYNPFVNDYINNDPSHHYELEP